MLKINCPQCGGLGYVELFEDPEDNPYHACYHCGTEGVVILDEADEDFEEHLNVELSLAAQEDKDRYEVLLEAV